MPIDTYPPQNVTAQTPTLAQAQTTTAQSAFSAETEILRVTFTVPAGRLLHIQAKMECTGTVTGDGFAGDLRLSAVGGTGIGQTTLFTGATPGLQQTLQIDTLYAPAAGTYTILFTARRYSGTGNLQPVIAANVPAFIIVEDITGSQLPVLPQSVPVGTLAQATVTANQGSITTEVDLTGATVTVTVPAGRTLRITGSVYLTSTVADDSFGMRIKEGATLLQESGGTERAVGAGISIERSVLVSPAAGQHTYKLTVLRFSGTGTVTNNASATIPSFILVEDITPTPAPASGAPAATLAYAEIVSNSASFTTIADVAGLSVTVTVAAGRRIRVSASAPIATTVGSPNYGTLFIYEGATELAKWTIDTPLAQAEGCFPSVVLTPSAGTHTYNVKAALDTGTGVIGANAFEKAYILVEDISAATVTPVATGPNQFMPITLGYTQITTGQGSITTPVDITGLSVTVNVPAGRRLRITGSLFLQSTVNTDGVRILIAEGGTTLQLRDQVVGTAGPQCGLDAVAIVTPSEGSHTYKIQGGRWTGTGTVTAIADATYPSYILVEDITGSGLPVSNAAVPVGVIGETIMSAGVDQGSITTVETAIAGDSVTVTVPSGRLLKLRAFGSVFSSVAADSGYFRIKEGATTLGYSVVYDLNPTTENTYEFSALVSPSAGSHTYSVTLIRNAGTGSLTHRSNGTIPAKLWVEDITPTPAPAQGAPSSLLAQAQVTTAQTIGATSTETDLTGLAVTVTVPAGRTLKITGHSGFQAGVAGDRIVGYIKEGATYQGRYGQEDAQQNLGYMIFDGCTVITPSAGTHTYKLTAQRYGGTGSLLTDNAPDRPGAIYVEDITGVSLPQGYYPNGSIPVAAIGDTGWINVTLVNSWVVYDNTYGPNGYSGLAVAPLLRKVAGIVYLRGLIKSGTLGVSVMTLPAGYRPSMKLLFTTMGDNNVLNRYDVQSDGNVINAAGASNTWSSLNGISFVAEQ